MALFKNLVALATPKQEDAVTRALKDTPEGVSFLIEKMLYIASGKFKHPSVIVFLRERPGSQLYMTYLPKYVVDATNAAECKEYNTGTKRLALTAHSTQGKFTKITFSPSTH